MTATETAATKIRSSANHTAVQAAAAQLKRAAAPKEPKPSKQAASLVAPAADKPKVKPLLRKPQVKILAVLAKATGPMTRKDIVAETGLDTAWMTTWIGPGDLDARAKSDEKYNLSSLLTLKHVKCEPSDDLKSLAYVITAAGRKALEKASA